MSHDIVIEVLTAGRFARFGDVLDCAGAPDKLINQRQCGRYHDRAQLDFDDGRAGLSLFNAVPRTLPMELLMVERHPQGSQAFVPMTHQSFLVVVAPDENGVPGPPQAFRTAPGQAVNYHRGTWHGVLTPLHGPGLFAVVDRIGTGDNLEEFWFDTAYRIVPA